MVSKGEKMRLTWKIWLFLIVFVLALISLLGIPPTFLEKGVLIKSVELNSTAFDQGLRQNQIITSIDGTPINNMEDFTKLISSKFYSGEKIKLIITTTNSEVILFSNHTPEITVSDIPKTNLKLGLDLVGGSRALVKANGLELTLKETQDLAEIIENRLNVYGLTDIKVIPVSDLSGDNYIKIELAGATPKDIKELIGQQGKFEAKIGNQTVFIGGDKDITSVARGGQESGVYECNPITSGGFYCNFRFSVFLSEEAAKRHANITNGIEVNSTSQGAYLAERLDLYVDDILVDSLLISESLKGSVTTQIAISGSGNGETKEEAIDNAESSMKKLQTILITGSLPYKLEISKLDTISPNLGSQFIKSIFLAGFTALFCVACVIFMKYKRIKPSLAILFVGTSEILITLGIAAFLEINLDLPAIAGVLAAIGTGVNDQIVILDETQREMLNTTIKERIKRAFQIIMGAYFTLVVAMIPLYFAGAGLLKGFALTTIIGLTLGVTITRPAFTDMVKLIEE